jgi:hypothetical protein
MSEIVMLIKGRRRIRLKLKKKFKFPCRSKTLSRALEISKHTRNNQMAGPEVYWNESIRDSHNLYKKQLRANYALPTQD